MKPSPSEISDGASAPSRRRRYRWVLWGVIIVAGVGLFRWASGGIPVPSAWVKAALDRLDPYLSKGLSVDDVRWFFPLTFELHGVRLVDDARQDLVRIDSARVRLKLLGRARLTPARILAHGVTVWNEGEGAGRLERWLQAAPREGPSEGASWRVEQWRVEDLRYWGRLADSLDTLQVAVIDGSQWYGKDTFWQGNVELSALEWNGKKVMDVAGASLEGEGDRWQVQNMQMDGVGLRLRGRLAKQKQAVALVLDEFMLKRQAWWMRWGKVPFEQVEGNGAVALTSDTLRIDRLRLRVDRRSALEGKGRIIGYRKGWAQAQFDFSHIKADVAREHLRQWVRLSLPGAIAFLGYRGRWHGRESDMTFDGTFRLPQGKIRTRARLSRIDGQWHYEGAVSPDLSGLHALFPKLPVQRFSGRFRIKGQGHRMKDLHLHVDGRVASVATWPRGRLDNMYVRGELMDRFFSGLIESRGPNADFTFNGIIDFNRPGWAISSEWQIGLIDLKALGFTSGEASVGGHFFTSGQWHARDSFDFRLRGGSLFLASSEGGIVLDTLHGTFRSTRYRKKMSFQSSAIRGALEGHFQWDELLRLAAWWGHQFWNYPRTLPDTSAIPLRTYARGRLLIRHPEVLLGIFDKRIHVSDSIVTTFRISRRKLLEQLKMETGAIQYAPFRTAAFRIKYEGGLALGTAMLNVTGVALHDRLLFDDVHFTAAMAQHTAQWNLLALRNDLSVILPLRGRVRRWGDDSLRIAFTPIDWIIADSTWHFSSTAWRWQPRAGWKPGRLLLRSGDSHLSFAPSDTTGRRYSLRMWRFPLGYIGRHLGGMLAVSDGPVSGRLGWHRSTRLLDGNVRVDPFLFTGDTIGPLHIHLRSDTSLHRTQLQLALKGPDDRKWIEAAGEVSQLNKVPLTHLRVRIRKVPFSVLKNYYAHLISDLEGTLNGYVFLEGRMDAPLVVGQLEGQDVAFTVNYLKTRYRIDHTFHFDQQRFYIDSLPVLDQEGHKASVNGYLSYKYFAGTQLDVSLRLDTFHVLNTTAADNRYFYGQAFASGLVSFQGPLDDVFMNADLKSEDGTDVYLPLTDEKPSRQYPFIQWTSARPLPSERQASSGEAAWLRYVMTTTLTPAARVRIIIDPATQEYVQGRGRGIITFGEPAANVPFFIRGRYEIESGDYYFTALDLFERRFAIEPGGYILWMGDPYEARIHVVASYRLYAAIDDLLATTLTPQQYQAIRGQRYPVKVLIYLTGALMHPDIRLDFQIEGGHRAGSEAERVLASVAQRIKADPDELTRQVMSLLLFERFVPLRAGFSSAIDRETVYQNISSILSAQMSRLLNRLTSDVEYIDNLQLGVVYAPASQPTGSRLMRRRVELALSTELFNERFFISGRYDFQNLLGNLQVSYRLTPDRSVRLHAFVQTQQNLWLGRYSQQGVGISFSKDFETWQELFNIQRKNERKKQ